MSRSRNRQRKQNFQAQKKAQRKETKKQRANVTNITSARQEKSTYAASTGGNARPARTSWCDHWQVPFNLGDGHVIFASAWSDKPGRWQDDQMMSLVPDIGFYLDSYWGGSEVLVSPGLNLPELSESKTKVILFPWPDRGAPIATLRKFKVVCEWLINQIDAGCMVETGCFAAHGRTGTLLASLLVLKGAEANAAIQQVRRDHCNQSVESWEQIDFIKRFDSFVNGREHDRRPPTPSAYSTVFAERQQQVTGMSAADIEAAAAKTMEKYNTEEGFASSLDTTGMTPATKQFLGLTDTEADRLTKEDAEYEEWLRRNSVDMSDYMGGSTTDDALLREHTSYVGAEAKYDWGAAYGSVTGDTYALFQATCPWCGSTNVDWVKSFDFVCNMCDMSFTDKYADRGI